MTLIYFNDRLRPNGETEGFNMTFNLHYQGTFNLVAGSPASEPFKPQANERYHYAATYDGSTQKFYVNGETLLNSLVMGVLDRPREVEKLRATSTNDWNLIGAVDSVRIYNRALDEAEVSQNLQAVVAVNLGGKLASRWGAIKKHISRYCCMWRLLHTPYASSQL